VVAAPKPNPIIEDIITAYRVVGIIWSESPQAILEDTKTNSTTLVNRGALLKGARIKDILKDRVILSYDNKDIELR
jgi:type II secretory pathway component PulC